MTDCNRRNLSKIAALDTEFISSVPLKVVCITLKHCVTEKTLATFD